MSNWNYDMSAAPKGMYVKTTRKIGKNETDVETWVPVRIIAGGNCGTVTISQWNHRRQAWSMFTAAVPPIAWQPWPDAP